MGSVTLRGNSIVISYKGGSAGAGTVSPGESQASIRGKIASAIAAARTREIKKGNDDGVDDLGSININAAASSIYAKASAPKQEAPAAAPKPAAPAKAAPKPAAPRKPQTVERKAAPEKPEETMKKTPRIEPSIEWIEKQLDAAASSSDRTAQKAATDLHTHSNFVDEYLEAGIKRGGQRLEKQTAATARVFDSLYKIPRFSLYLTSQAAARPEFAVLEAFLTEFGDPKPLKDQIAAYLADPSKFPEFTKVAESFRPGKQKLSPDEAVTIVVRAADFYVRHYLITFEGKKDTGIKKFREELDQLKRMSWRIQRTEESYKGEQRDSKIYFRRLYLTGPMDAATITAAALYIRRWNREHPKFGKGTPQDRISVWQAPEPIPVQKREAKPAVDYSEKLKLYAEVLKAPKIGVIGASVTQGGIIGKELQRILRESNPKAYVRSYGVKGQSSGHLLARFDNDIIRHDYNVVVISGYARVNETGSLDKIKKNFEEMISKIRENDKKKGKKTLVVVFGAGPYAGYKGWSEKAQQRADEFNDWLRSNEDIVYVDISAIGEGDPPRLKKKYDSGDGLHPNAAGRVMIGKLIAGTLYAEAKKKVKIKKSPVELYANKHWQDLPKTMMAAVTSGDPKALIFLRSRFLRAKWGKEKKLTDSLSPALRTFEGALKYLGRDDIPRTVDRVYNEYLAKDKGFVEFMKGNDRYKKYAGVTLSPETDSVARARVVEAMQAYLREVTQTNPLFKEDMEILARQIFKSRRLDVDGRTEDMHLIAAVALYGWRQKNGTMKPSHADYWARGIKGVKLPTQETGTKTEEQTKERRIRIYR